MRCNIILNVTANMHRWKLSALAAAAFVSAALTPTDAAALALGSIRVQSALGEALRAEIAIPQATTAELNSLAVQIASPEIFRAQGMDYSNAARSIQVQLHRNADGTASLRLSSNTPLQDPFIDLVLETQWSAGHLVRSYTVLLDPPSSQRTAAAPAQAPQIAPPATASPTATASVTGRNYASNNTAPQRATRPAPPPAPTSSAPAAETAEKSTRVRSGDTAGHIANANRPTGVSLDQMLVAMLQSNPNAFINGNVNRIRAGAVVQMPSREQALQTSATEARQIVAAQSRDFNAYRRSLASKAPQASVQAADRSSGGQVQAHVEDASPAAGTPDKLTLSKSSVQSAAASDEKLAAQKQASDQSNRLNELQRNLAELNELTQNTSTTAASTPPASAATGAPATATPPAEAATTASAAPAIEVATPSVTEPSSPATDSPTNPAEATAQTEPQAPVAATDSAANPAAQKKPAPATTPAPAAAAPSFVDDLLDNPLIPAGGGLIALLLGFLGYSAWKRRRAAQAVADPSLGDSQLHPDSFFGSSGGQQVDTSNADTGASTMAYAPSQLDGGGDVDAVAEADVYLAYGRDVQAEEILKEALRNQPERLSIHVKLAEIYVKRNDIKALENIAQTMQHVSQSQDPEWQRVVEMGRNMDPTNPFFAAASSAAGTTASKPTSAFAAALNTIKPDTAGSAAATTAVAATAAGAIPDIDLHLDLPDDGLASQTVAADIPAAAPLPSDDDFAALELPGALDSQLDITDLTPQDPPTLVQDTLMAEDNTSHDLSGLDLDLSGFEMPPAPATATTYPATDTPQEDGLNFDLDTPAAEEPVPPVTPAAQAPAAIAGEDFDLGSLDLDLGASPESATEAEPVHNLADDPLSTKLDLAQEFNAIGDSEGARSLIEEVLAEASGPLKERAQKMLSEID